MVSLNINIFVTFTSQMTLVINNENEKLQRSVKKENEEQRQAEEKGGTKQTEKAEKGDLAFLKNQY